MPFPLASQMSNKVPKHIVNLLLLLGSFLLFGLVAKSYVTDPSFYKFGHYRSDAVPELAAATPLFRGAGQCQICHANRKDDWSVSTHRTVQCEVCHGADREHPGDGQNLTPTDTIRLCTNCHEAMPARPAWQPQIVLGQHPFPGAETPQCHTCHDPHSPGGVQPETAAPSAQTPAAATTRTPISPPASASSCAACHGQLGEGVNNNPVLAGLKSAVFVERMNLYKSGAREDKIMATFARSLSDADIAELARYYESLGARSPE